MRAAGFLVLAGAACLTTLFALPAAAGAPADQGTNAEVEKVAPPPDEGDGGYRPRWADPNAKPSEPGVENDPTPFDPADVDANSNTLDNTINNVDQ
jgi:hypothetical protein